jgi:hypothetical protein
MSKCKKKQIIIGFLIKACIGIILITNNVSAATIPQTGSGPIVVNQKTVIDNITFLIAGGAARPDTTAIQSYDNLKHGWLYGLNDDDFLEWTVELAEGKNFDVTSLVNPLASKQSFSLTVKNTPNALSFIVNETGWQRHQSGVLYIPAGKQTLRFVRTTNNADVQIKSIELIESESVSTYKKRVAAFKSKGSKFNQAEYGLMFQYGAWGYPKKGSAKNLNDQTNDFDVARFVDMVKSTGADYVIWSATWWTYEFNMPIDSVDSILGHSNRTSTKDLVGEIALALDAENVEFVLYYHTGQDSHVGLNSTDWWQAQNWPTNYAKTGTGDRSSFFNNWKAVISEIGNRYGKLLDGWLFDDGLLYYPAPFEALGAAARAGNTDRLISYNPWIIAHYTEFADLAFGEHCNYSDAPIGSNGLYTSGADIGLYGHCMPRMENDWGINSKNQTIASPNFTVASALEKVTKASSRNVPTSFNLMMYEDGTVSQASLDVLIGLKKALAATSNCGDKC